MITPLNWSGLVDEALKRRKKEHLTQKEHAAIAGVSIPTIIAFDRKLTSLSLNKAIDILSVVGLVAEPSAVNSQDIFIHDARTRWQSLIKETSEGSPSRQGFGHYSISYQLTGFACKSTRELINHLKKAGRKKYTGWPPFWIPTKTSIAPYPYEEGVECWLGKPDADRIFDDAAHSDFWRASLDGHLYLQRGYQEDADDILKPASIFDLTLPIWRTGEVLLHAHHLAQSASLAPNSECHFSIHYQGLAGRELKSWANPYRSTPEFHRCRVSEITNSARCKSTEIGEKLPNLVHHLLLPVYEAFDFYELKQEIVTEELSNLQRERSGGRGQNP